MNRNLALEFVRVTEMAAIASARYMGRGDEGAFAASIEAMHCMLDSVECKATVVIGAIGDIATHLLKSVRRWALGVGITEIALDLEALPFVP